MILTKPSTSSNTLLHMDHFLLFSLCATMPQAQADLWAITTAAPRFLVSKFCYPFFLEGRSENITVCMFCLEGPAKMSTIGFHLNSLIYLTPYWFASKHNHSLR
jgi:hypothetical protein